MTHKELQAILNKLCELLGGESFPCRRLRQGKSCIQQESGTTKDGTLKLFYSSECRAAERLCDTCAAYFHVAVARNKMTSDQRWYGSPS